MNKLSTKPLIQVYTDQLTSFFETTTIWSYLAIIMIWNDPWSAIYVRNKIQFGKRIGCQVKLFDDKRLSDNNSDYPMFSWKDIYNTVQRLIYRLNDDPLCLGVVIQLPLPDSVKPYQQALCDTIYPSKDCDAMSSYMMWRMAVWMSWVIYPAVVNACLEILDYAIHQWIIDILKGQQISIIWQSNLVGKPLLLALINRWVQVHSFGIDSEVEPMKHITSMSNSIISWTGNLWLVDQTWIGDRTRLIIDVWYGFDEHWHACWDVDADSIQSLSGWYTPVPWGVWPLCVTMLFVTIMNLVRNKTSNNFSSS